jgi:hypothetical protein
MDSSKAGECVHKWLMFVDIARPITSCAARQPTGTINGESWHQTGCVKSRAAANRASHRSAVAGRESRRLEQCAIGSLCTAYVAS